MSAKPHNQPEGSDVGGRESTDDVLRKWLSRQARAESRAEVPVFESVYPLSFGQQRLWFLWQMDRGNPVYNYAEALRLDGGLSPRILEQAVESVVDAHSSLRTSFEDSVEGPRQRVHRTAEFEFESIDLSDSQTDDRYEEAVRLGVDRARAPFDLETPGQLRVTLIKIKEKSHLLVLSMHHIITDKWSMRIFFEDLGDAYRKFAEGGESGSDRKIEDYFSFALEQRSRPEPDDDIEWWRCQLEGAPSRIDLPYSFRRPEKPSFRGRFNTRQMPGDLSYRILELSKRLKTTPFTLLATAFTILLHKFSGQDDIVIGTPFSNRDRESLERTIGFFNETLVVRSALSANETFIECLEATRRRFVEALGRPKIPFEVLVRQLAIERSLNANPLFQAMFIYHNAEPAPFLVPGIKAASETLDLGVSKFDLTLYIEEESGGLKSIFEYATDLFSDAFVESLQDRLLHLLGEIVEDPGKRVVDLKLWSPTVEELSENSTSPAFEQEPAYRSVVEIFDSVVSGNPEAIALDTPEGSLTYSSLKEESERIGNFLAKRDLPKGTPIGVLSQRSPTLFAAFLGVLRSGLAYVPLDPDYPAQRTADILKASKAPLLITDLPPDSAQDLSENGFSGEIVEIATVIDEGSDAVRVQDYPGPGDPAYLIYTSGSSGKPKSVVITHANLFNSTNARFEYYETAPESFLLMSSVAFDSSVAGIYWTLCSGGSLVVPPARIEQDIEGLAKLIRDAGVTHMLLLPSLYSLLLRYAKRKDLRGLETVVVAGEACPESLCRLHREKLPDAALFNEYGPTEATVWSTVERIDRIDNGPVPIGGPVAGTRIMICDDGGFPVPQGVPGEIWIGGANVAAGYHLDPELTAGSFVAPDWVEDPGIRFYRSGDLGRFTENGTLLLFGRKDNQLKLRGYRIEPGEIEAAMILIEGVSDAAIVPIGDSDQSSGSGLDHAAKKINGLAGFYSGTDCEPEALIAELKKRLPPHMVPSVVQRLDGIPRLPNGKIDRRNLPAPEQKETQENPSRPPRNNTEEKLLSIWSEVLGIDVPGIDDNFFEIGGDSLSSIRIVAKARERGIGIDPASLFELQTVAELSEAVALRPETIDAGEFEDSEVRLTPVQDWFFENYRAAPHFWNQIYRIECGEQIGEAALREAVRIVTEANDALRLQFSRSASGWRPSIRENAGENFSAVELMAGPAKIGDILGEHQINCRLDSDPLFRVFQFKDSNSGPSQIYLIAHHLVIDAISWGTVIQDLFRVCEAIRDGGDPNLAIREERPEFREWTARLDDLWSRVDREEELEFWQEQTKNTGALNLEGSASLPYPEAEARSLHLTLQKDLTERLLFEIPAKAASTVEEVLAGALLKTLSSYAEGTRLAIEFEKHGRDALETGPDYSETVGWFTALFPLGFETKGLDSAGDFVTAARSKLRKIKHGGAGYGLLARSGVLEGGGPDHGSPSVIFNYLGANVEHKSASFGRPEHIFEGARHPDSERHRLLEFNILKDKEQMTVRCDFPGNSISSEIIAKLLSEFETDIREAVEYLVELQTGKDSAIEFSEAGLSDEDLATLFDKLN
ncbi:MAG: amino acid adenylation domain-containing protein [Acidobacteria bacterium]|nr:MAG: amino acid adenylation domain-containing protein [Acidobacteriota bacterium]REJ98985.1 MAG: amino acid adenylation domain-containing protein [Acidobacteriota bacterium]REK16295.1 MAG: amino acid adenylation domain-containing protein [Acidobacteriota bacterium]REK43976.1 MAG: amino acid adenylation domain-containing protein [Acidobacteriota bacterium]